MLPGDKRHGLRHDRGVSGTTAGLAPLASFRGVTARGLIEISHDVADLDRGGRWAVAVTFEGDVTLARFRDWSPGTPQSHEIGRWHGPSRTDWRDSLPQEQYVAGVRSVRERVAAGDVYQVNLCRLLSADLPDSSASDPGALWRQLREGNPAPYEGFLRLPGVRMVSASPELFLRRKDGVLTSGPIKGTATEEAGLTDKDRAENVMIVDLIRNDLARVCVPGSVAVPHLLRVEAHPGLVHLVSYVSGTLQSETSWATILRATMPPGSVSGAPKLAALDVIRQLEPVPRQFYCGAFGWIDADAGTARLAVAIRSFWVADGQAWFGTGAGITWGSDPQAEWEETQLKARRLVRLASAPGMMEA